MSSHPLGKSVFGSQACCLWVLCVVLGLLLLMPVFCWPSLLSLDYLMPVVLLFSFLLLSHIPMVSFLTSFRLPFLSTFQSFSVPFLSYLLSLPPPRSHPIHSRISGISIHVGLLFHPLDQNLLFSIRENKSKSHWKPTCPVLAIRRESDI